MFKKIILKFDDDSIKCINKDCHKKLKKPKRLSIINIKPCTKETFNEEVPVSICFILQQNEFFLLQKLEEKKSTNVRYPIRCLLRTSISIS